MHDLERRGFIYQEGGCFSFTVPLFAQWLIEQGPTQLMSDALAEEYESAVVKARDAAKVTPAEIALLLQKWPIYQGQQISADSVRGWLDQVDDPIEQRLLFKCLQRLKLFSAAEIREGMKTAHVMLGQYLRPFVQETRRDRRVDVLVTYVDGLGKSGAKYAGYYADENKISSKCVVSPREIIGDLDKIEQMLGSSISAIVVVDDFIGTGRSLSENLKLFLESTRAIFLDRGIRLFVVAIAATAEGEQSVRNVLRKEPVEVEFRVCEIVSTKLMAFAEANDIWRDESERQQAKALCLQLGAKVHRSNPLGFGDLGMLVVLPENCPNNSLPVLHAGDGKDGRWRPLFPRSKS